jgi:hypothetical protein
LERRIVEGYAAHHPPSVSESVDTWVGGWLKWDPNWDAAPEARFQKLKARETLEQWADGLRTVSVS